MRRSAVNDKSFEPMKRLLFILLFFPLVSFAQEMRFVVEQSCLATGMGMNFKCKKESKEFTLVHNGRKFTGIHPSGVLLELKLLEMTPYIIVL